jgi:DNA-binding transcriptional ArsR family regulator
MAETITPSSTLLGLLADEQRLRVFAAIALGSRTVEAVAESVDLDVATVQAVLPRLVSTGLVERRDGLQVSLDTLRTAARSTGRPASTGASRTR